jgi:hypothetical protein
MTLAGLSCWFDDRRNVRRVRCGGAIRNRGTQVRQRNGKEQVEHSGIARWSDLMQQLGLTDGRPRPSQERHSGPDRRRFRIELACRCTNIAVKAAAGLSSGSAACQTLIRTSRAPRARRHLSSACFPPLRPEVAALLLAAPEASLDGDSPRPVGCVLFRTDLRSSGRSAPHLDTSSRGSPWPAHRAAGQGREPAVP